jgi:hypothetical protein
MAQTKTTRHNIVTRCLAAMALVSVYCVGLIGASTVLLTTSSTSAEARGGGRGRGRGWRLAAVDAVAASIVAAARGYGRGYGFYGGPRFVAPGCYFSRRWGRVVCPY